MRQTALVLSGGIWIAFIAACGKAPPPPGLPGELLGGELAGLPTGAPPADPGILQDQTTYQPATPPPPTAGSGAARRAASAPAAAQAASDGESPAHELLAALLNDLESGDLELVLDAIDAAQIHALRERMDFLWSSQEAWADVQRAVTRQLGDTAGDQLSATLRKRFLGAVRIEPAAGEFVVTPNPLLVLLGPARTADPLRVARVDGQWRFQLPGALTGEDVAAAAAYHEVLQAELRRIQQQLGGQEFPTAEAVADALGQAIRGGPAAAPTTGPDVPAP